MKLNYPEVVEMLIHQLLEMHHLRKQVIYNMRDICRDLEKLLSQWKEDGVPFDYRYHEGKRLLKEEKQRQKETKDQIVLTLRKYFGE